MLKTGNMGAMPNLLTVSPQAPSTIIIATVIFCVAIFLLLFKQPAGKHRSTKTSAAKLDANKLDVPPVATKPKAYLLFGTQTGTAERFCKSLRAQLMQRYGESMEFEVMDMEDYDAASRLGTESLVFLIAATYGDGEPTDNATVFYNYLVANAQAVADGERPPFLQKLHFAIFGLGNKQYEHFCAVGKRFESTLLHLGATRLVRRGDGDDDDDIDADFASWCEDLFIAMDNSTLVEKQAPAGPPAAADLPSYAVTKFPAGTPDPRPTLTGTGTDANSLYGARVLVVKELYSADAGRSCVHVELDVGGLSYTAGDHVAVYAENHPAVVARAAKLLGLKLNDVVQLTVPEGVAHGTLSTPPAGPLSIRRLLLQYVDLAGAVHREQLEALAAFATDDTQATRLRQLCTMEQKQAFHEYAVEGKRCLLDVLEEFPSARPPLGALLGCVTQRLQPRFYSISSSPKLHTHAVHITCAVVDETMPTGRHHLGVASTYLATRKPGDVVPVYVRTSHFRLPPAHDVPVVMVGPGTGLAPFRGFCQEREALLKQGQQLAPAYLYFGCRRQKQDFLYEAELRAWVASGVLTALYLAFSRDGATKDYVQHHMLQHSAELWNTLQQKGCLYVCGDAKHMARDVHHALHDVAQQAGGYSSSQAEAFVKALADGNRYQKDVW